MLVIVFTVSMFLSAALLFLVEPMLAKMMLPLLGGTPAVWNTCLVFFQAMLLAGYLYAHAAMKWFGRRTQIAVHMTLLVLPLLPLGLLPLHLPAGWQPPAESNPVLWVLGMLFLAVGLPFFVLSSNTPIMQRWFSDSGHKHATDPYFLYAASNAGSLAGLLAYPLLLEPLLHLSEQSHLWTYAYIVFVAITAACALLVWSRRVTATKAVPAPVEESDSARIWKQRFRWIALAFIPSSLMLGVTSALTTDVPAIPLFWVLPLALYLISFILVFAQRPPISHSWLIRWLPLLILIGLFPVISRFTLSLPILLPLYLVLLLGVALFCHGELARSRPQIHRLTEFYLWISVGGVLGGIFNSLLAPLVFHSVLEFPLVLIATALLIPKPGEALETGAATRWKDWILPLALGLSMAAIILGVARLNILPGYLPTTLFFSYAILWCWSFRKRPLRFAAGLTAMLIASSYYTGPFGHILDTERSFFGVVRVSNDKDGIFRYLIHGGTLHGVQSLDPARSREPLAYYTSSGPAGEIVRAVQAKLPGKDWAIVGLGAGAMACYIQPQQGLAYYEIDPLVARIAEDTHYFTFLQQCAPQAKIVLGDARLKLQNAPDSHYSLIVLDAFSGDSIPMHLITREALALYQRKLSPGGVIAFHISSNFLDLAPTLGSLAQDAHLACLIEEDKVLTPAQGQQGKAPSIWVAMARSPDDLAVLAADASTYARWVPLRAKPGAPVWTDDYSNLLSVIKWKIG